MITLGINAAFHDCSAALVRDGEVIAAAEEERFTRVKHGKRPVPFAAYQLPFHAIDYCLRFAGLHMLDVDRIGYAFDPRLLPLAAKLDTTGRPASGYTDIMTLATERLAEEDASGLPPLPESIVLPLEPSRAAPSLGDASPWDPLFLSYVVNAPRQLVGAVPHHLQERFAGLTYEQVAARWHWVEHHRAHEASAFLASPFDQCAVLTMDGRGERATTSLGWFTGEEYRRLRQVDLPHSLGLLYEDVTRWLGFQHASDEYKVMALAAFGAPEYVDIFREHVHATDDGAYVAQRFELTSAFGPARRRGDAMEQHHLDVARSLQQVLEDTVLDLAHWLHQKTRAHDLCLAGGVALNCVMNARLRDEGPFERVWVQPAAGDAGTALGAALWLDWHDRAARGTGVLLAPHVERRRRWRMDHACLGPAFDDDSIEDALVRAKISYRRVDNIAEAVAPLLARERIVGWFQGRMEFGPRALGARSILASPIPHDMQRRLNALKDREDFRPVAPMVLEERAHQWFSTSRQQCRAVANGPPIVEDDGLPAPFMTFTFNVRPERRDRIPAVRHIDGSARVQTVNRAQHPLCHALIEAFERHTGVPVIVNTSFNTLGRPIVCTPRDALEAFFTSPIDALAIGSFIVEKPV